MAQCSNDIYHFLPVNLIQNRYILLCHPTHVRVLVQETWDDEIFQNFLPIIGWFNALGKMLEDHQEELKSSKYDSFRRFFRSWSFSSDLHAGFYNFTFVGSLVIFKDTDQAVFCSILNAVIQFLYFVEQQ